MRFSASLLSALALAALACAKTPPAHLQIGVKHMPKSCSIKTQDGDEVYMCVPHTLR